MDRLRLLLIEDDEDDFVLIRDLLVENRRLNCAIDWAASYEAGLAAISAGGHDACLLDYRLGAASGLDLLREAQRLGYAAPIIMLTGQEALDPDMDIDLQALHAGATDYLVKSRLDAISLQRMIRYALAERRRLHQSVQLVQAREAQAVAEAASRAKDEFVAIVSHELRNPLTAILGWIEVLKRTGGEPERFERAVAAIERSALAQKRIIEDLLDSSRITTGQLRLSSQPVDVCQAIEAALEVIRPSAVSKQITLSFERAEPCIVAVDPDRLQQVFWNLLSNAIKFTPSEGRVLIVLLREDRRVSVRVADSGPGVHPDLQRQIFDRFRQFDAASGTRHSGVGLGLSLTRELVAAHGGEVGVQSPGEQGGATFIVTLPLARP